MPNTYKYFKPVTIFFKPFIARYIVFTFANFIFLSTILNSTVATALVLLNAFNLKFLLDIALCKCVISLEPIIKINLPNRSSRFNPDSLASCIFQDDKVDICFDLNITFQKIHQLLFSVIKTETITESRRKSSA